MQPLLSAYCDGEVTDESIVREHLRACGGCRATLREYREAPRAAAALAPLLPGAPTLLERAQQFVSELQSRLPGGGTDPGLTQAAGGSAGAGGAVTAGATTAGGAGAATVGGAGAIGTSGLVKALAVCAGTAGAATACIAAGIVPAPPNPLSEHRSKAAEVERVSKTAFAESEVAAPPAGEQAPARAPDSAPGSRPTRREPEPTEPPPAPVDAGAVEYTPTATAPESVTPAAPPPAPAAPPPSTSVGTAAGEFGP
jgi:hypothetical protein